MNYKVRIKVKWSIPWNGVAPLLHPSVVAIEKGAFESLSTKVANFTYYFFDGAYGEFFTSHNPPSTYIQGFLRVSFDTDIVKLSFHLDK